MELTVFQLVLVCLLVCLAGLVDAVAGGGGLISLPAYLAVGVPPHAALGTNKFSSVAGTLAATVRYARAGKVHLRLGLLAAAGALAGSTVGARAVLAVPASAVSAIVVTLVPAVFALLFFRHRLVARAPVSAEAPARHAAAKTVAIGFVVGAWDGFFGPGTGTFLTIGFHVALRLDLLAAAGNARLANLASNAGAVTVFLLDADVLFPLAFYTAAAGVAGNLFGAVLALRRGERLIRPFLVGVMGALLAEVIRRRFC